MTIAVANTKSLLAAYYATLGSWLGLATANPGSTATVSNEATGGLPAYARVQTTWSPGSFAGAQGGTPVTFNVGPGNYTYSMLCANSTGNNMIDNAQIQTTLVLLQATLVCTPTFVQQ